MKIQIRTLYKCGSCGDIHDDEDGARECCQPEVEEMFECPVCKTIHDGEDEARLCCESDSIKCPSCYRDHSSITLSFQAIKIAGHCTTCNPMFTIDQQQAIQDLHYQETGRREHLFD
ncbi:hypothetical protein QU617_09740 [Pseudomonas guariconensis]|uniref:hypothetical protein n=1 Tax=Pseudomonas guariconensis TaxID=1288410 RepID=UPI0025A9648D|nr:hypothetical protein [Pseudomonas guariconensis]MDM9593592.1 hypothetical protein [Pseudomonas guariconensis]MDM9606419.1 hypothetical protein [Pseudomonas guariconensis]MDM9611375.1 hypothetical protein [Pseudomonas guariconensis]